MRGNYSQKRRFPYQFSLNIFAAALLFQFFPIHAEAASGDSLSYSYQKGLNTDSWRASLVLKHVFCNNITVLFREDLHSSRFKIAAAESRWKDRHNAEFLLEKPLLKELSLAVNGQSSIFIDRHTGFENDASTHQVTFGGHYKGRVFQIPGSAGIKEDRRFNQKDAGATYKLGLQIPQIQWGEYHHRFAASHQGDRLNQRKNLSTSINYQVHRQFNPGTADTLTFALNHQRRDYYISAAGLIESRDEQTQYAENRLQYKVKENINFRSRFSLSARQLDISLIDDGLKNNKRKRDDFTAAANIRCVWQGNTGIGEIEFNYITEEQIYQIAGSAPSSPFSGSGHLIPDNNSEEARLKALMNIAVFGNDSIMVYSSIQRYSYDTPDTNNYDNRDEFRWNMEVEYQRYLRPQLKANIALSVYMIHFVYIHGERSSDNNWTRIFRMTPKITWQPNPSVTFTKTAEVLANYVQYDFEHLLPSVRSFVYRQLVLSDSLIWQAAPHLNVSLFYRLDLDENGKFLWDQWLQERLMERNSHTLAIQLDIRPMPYLSIQPGWTMYRRKGYQYHSGIQSAANRQMIIHFSSEGPIFSLYYWGKRIRLLFSASSMATRTFSGQKKMLNRLQLSCKWNL